MLVLAFVLACGSSYGQVATASLGGTLRDTSGAVIAGGAVSVRQAQTGVTARATTDNNGLFSLPALPVGSYTLTAEAPGFGVKQEAGIVLTVGQSADFTVVLTPGGVKETVTIDASAPLVDTSSPTIQNTIERTSVANLPLNGRNPAGLVFDVAGATDSVRGQVSTGQLATNSPINPTNIVFANEIAPAVNGVRAGGTFFSLDGTSNVDPFTVIGGPFPDPDATQEFQVVTGTYGSRYVSAPGGAVNIVTIAGTNKLHGTVFEFLRNGYVNAENALQGTPDPLKRNQFGGTVGGPLRKDKLFYFGSYQGSRIASQTINTYAVPTAAERNGIFQACPKAQTCTASNTFPLSLATLPPIFGSNAESVIAKNFFNYKGSGNSLIPTANNAAGNQYTIGVPLHSDEKQFVVRLDDQLTDKQRIFARYFYDHTNIPAVSYPAVAPYNILSTNTGERQYFDNAALGHTWTPSANLVLESRVSYLNVVADQTPGSTNGLANYQSLGASNYAEPNPPGDAITVISGLITPTSYSVVRYPRTSFTATEDVTYIQHGHEVTFGGDYNRIHSGENNPEGPTGVAIFAGVYTPIIAGIVGLQVLDSQFADFFYGRPIEFIQGDGFFQSIHGNLMGLYGQDKWRLSKRLTTTYGLRWDPFFPYTSERNQLSCFVPGQSSAVFPNAPKGLVFPGDPSCPTGGVNKTMNLFEPRVGFAYQLNEKGTQTVRAGYGIYTIQVPLRAYNGFSSWPFARRTTLVNPFERIDDIYGSNGVTNPFLSGYNGYGYQPPANLPYPSAPQIEAALAPNFRPAYIQQFSLSLQNQFSNHDSIEMAYVGSKGVKLAQNYDQNLPVGATSTGGEQVARPYPSIGQISTAAPVGWSKYNSLQVTYRHSTSFGLNVLSNFTWSKCRDNGSSPGDTGVLVGGDLTYIQTNPRFSNGLCDFDEPYKWHTTIVYTTPELKGRGAFTRQALGSWVLTNNSIVDSGQPFSVLSGNDNSFTGVDTDRGDYAAGNPPLFVNGKLNFYAFTQNAAGTLGNTPRNAYRAAAYLQVDTGLMKTFSLTERFGLLIRAESFNVLNHPNYYAPYNQLSSNNPVLFGTYQGAHDPRQLQIAAKLIF